MNDSESDWFAYACTSGDVMFFYNIRTGEHRWPTNSSCFGKTILKVRTSDVPPKPIQLSSVSTQTEDFGCVNQCTSMYVDNERQMENRVSESNKMEEVSDVNTTEVSEQNTFSNIDVNCVPDEVSEDAELDESLVTMVKLKRRSGIVQNIRPKKKRNGASIYHCSYCGRTFKRKGHHDVHLRTHTGEKPHECSKCDKTFAHKSNLQVHLRRHAGEKPYECSYCDKAFVQKCALDVHVRTHTGEKPYKCSYCDKVFSTRSHLTIHLRAHTGDKPYECPQCGKAFAQKGDLVVHIRIHTGEKPYKCSYCGKAFPVRTKLNLHLRTHARRLKATHECSK